MNIHQAKEKLQQKIGRKIELEESIDLLCLKIKKEKRYLKNVEKAQEIIRQVGLETQKQLQYHIEDVTSLALEGIFNEPYKIVLDFVERRGKTECDILFERNGERIDPMGSSGGGTVDVASFALRIASWSMQLPKKRNVIILDEPLRFLSKDNQERASEMIKQLSEKLKLQFIIVTHEPILTSYADKIFEVSISKRGISKIKTM
jgi:DNA repair exonuclease SbcCD ATPase subunit